MENKDNFNYNYMVISAGFACYKYVFRQLNGMDNAVYIDEIRFWSIVNVLYRIYFSKKINSIVELPFKRQWISLLLHYLNRYAKKLKKNTNNEKICFLFLAGGKIFDFLDYDLKENVKKFFPDSKIVFFCADLIEKTGKPINKLKEQSDVVISFDKGDALKYELFFHNIPYSDISVRNKKCSSPQFDICFLGAAKDRLEEIYRVYEFLIENNIKCDFHLIDVPIKERKYTNQIKYYDGLISYEDNISILTNSRCILEIMQKGGTGNTLRVNEAIIFDKKLLSNNLCLLENKWYEKKYMKVFRSLDNSVLDFVKDEAEVMYEHKAELYPDKFLEFVDSKL